MQNNLKTIKKHLLSLKANWDDNGAEPVSTIAFQDLEDFLHNMPDLGTPIISPCPDGSIDAYWPPRKLPHKIAYMLINFNVDEDNEYYVKFTDGQDDKGFLHNNKIYFDF